MRFSDTIASQCRYGEIAESLWNSWDVIWEDSEADYQGHAAFLLKKGSDYTFYEWFYGSCSGCDEWERENLSAEEIATEMMQYAMTLHGREELATWLMMLEQTHPKFDSLENVAETKIAAIRTELGRVV
jgi:hypothetical protein